MHHTNKSVQVNAQIVLKPITPVLIAASRCGSGVVVIQAISSEQVSWFNTPTGGQLLDTGLFFVTPVIDSTTTYYAEAGLGCTSERVPVVATIYNNPIVDLGQDTIIILSGQSVSISAGPGFASYLWSTTETSSSINVNTQGTYNVQVTDLNGCTGFDEVFVSIITDVNTISGKALLEVYPNPAHEQLTIKLQELSSKTLMLKLYSIDGKIIISEEIKSINSQFTKTLSLSGIVAGVYFLVIENNEYFARVKVLVE